MSLLRELTHFLKKENQFIIKINSRIGFGKEGFHLQEVSFHLDKIKNTQLDSFTYTIEKGKVREFAIALGDEKDIYMEGKAVPPTFAAVIEFWGDPSSISKTLGLNLAKVLHGEQSYEYPGKLYVGDEITVDAEVEKVFSKAKMNFIIIKKEFINQKNELVLISRSTIIERH